MNKNINNRKIDYELNEVEIDNIISTVLEFIQPSAKDIEKVKVLCKEYERDMPTEMKLIYDVKSGNFKAEYKYDLVYTNDDIKTADHIADEWFEEVKNNNL